MKITVLGCGTSAGVPQIGCKCAICCSSNPKNSRNRCSLLLESAFEKILFDTGPDLRRQCLEFGVSSLTALIYTHAHADHIHGLDELRQINNITGKSIPTFAAEPVISRIRDRFPYAFLGGQHADGGFWRPDLTPQIFDGPFKIGDLDIHPFQQKHGKGQSWGFRIGDFAYSTDTDALDENAFSILEGVGVWIVDALRERPHASHAHLERTLSWIERLKPAQTYLTHMNHEVDYDDWMARLPPGVEPAYDGLIFEI